ncbi:MAG: ABC transporter substrate-binding protein [Kofleriaceae bacterium]
MRALVALCAMAALAHGEGRPHYGGTVEGALLGAPVTLDPPLAQTHAEITAVDLVFDTLYRVGTDGSITPHLATALPVVSKDHVRITLRKDVRFHDASPLVAADVVASLERVRTTSARWALAAVGAIRADGDLTIELALKAPQADLPVLLALPATAITKGGRPAGEKPVGTGAFSVESFDRRAKKLVLRAFDDHFAGRPYVDRLVLRWYDTPDGEARQYETGGAQLSARGVAPFTNAKPKYKANDVEGPAALLVFIGFGRKHADITAERTFRRALDLALSRTQFTSVSSGERVTASRLPVPIEAGGPGLAAADATADLAGAKAALAQAATRVRSLAPAQLGKLTLEVLYEDTRPDDRQVAERVAYALTKLGIKSVITAVPATTLRDRVKRGDCDLWIGQLAAPVTSATAWWGGAFAAGNDLWAEQRLATGAIDRAEAIKAFGERLPILPLVFRAVRMWHRTDVRGLGFDATGRPDLADLFYSGDPAKPPKGTP